MKRRASETENLVNFGTASIALLMISLLNRIQIDLITASRSLLRLW